MKQYQNQKGIALLELMLVIAIIAILLLGAIRYYVKVKEPAATPHEVAKNGAYEASSNNEELVE